MDDDIFQIPNYPDMIVIPFRIPWASASAARARRPARPPRDRLPAMGWAGASPSERPEDFEPPVQADASPPPPEARLIAARVDGRPGLAVSGLSDGALTLWRRGGEAAPPQELATFAADLDGSLWAADGKFLGWLFAEERALFDPDWLRSTSPGEILLAGQVPDEGAEPNNPAQNPAEQQLKEEMRHLEQPLDPLGGADPRMRAPGESPVSQPPIPFLPKEPLASPPAKPRAPTVPAQPTGTGRQLSPSGRPGPAAPGQVPLGFPDAESFASFGRQLHAGLKAAGFPDVYAAVRGSAVTGENFRTGAPFDVGRVSDLDVALASPSLFQRAKDFGIELRSGGHRTGPLDADALGCISAAESIATSAGSAIRPKPSELPSIRLRDGVGCSSASPARPEADCEPTIMRRAPAARPPPGASGCAIARARPGR